MTLSTGPFPEARLANENALPVPENPTISSCRTVLVPSTHGWTRSGMLNDTAPAADTASNVCGLALKSPPAVDHGCTPS